MKELITLEGDIENYDMQIVSLQGDFFPYENSQNAVLNGDVDFLEGEWVVDTATVEIPLNGEIYQVDVPLDGGFKMPKMKFKAPKMKFKAPKMKMKVNTKGLSRSLSSVGKGISKGVSSYMKSYGDMVSNVAQGAGGLLSNVAQGAGSLLESFGSGNEGGNGEEQTDDTEQTEENFQDDEGLENLPNEENEELNGLLSTIGSAAGSFLMPGVGTAAGGMIGNMLEQGTQKKAPTKKPKLIRKRKATPRDAARYSNLKARQTSVTPQNKSSNLMNQLNQNTSYSQPQQAQRQIVLKSYPDGKFALAPKVRNSQESDANPTGNNDTPNTDPIAPDPNNPPAKKKDDNTMLIIGGVAVAGILLLSMNKKGRK